MAETPCDPGAGGGFQSRLRPLVLLLERVLRHLLWGAPYTPPPMLSPLRRGSGLYFSTLCTPKCRGDPTWLFGAVLGTNPLISTLGVTKPPRLTL